MSQNRLIENFKSISNEVLLQNHNTFLNIAKDTFGNILNVEKAEYSEKQKEFKNLLNPIRETLEIFDKKISNVEKERVDAYSDLRRQINDLMAFNIDVRNETGALTKALSTPFISGQWGEMQLKRVVELTGMLPYCDFLEQFQSETSRLRPDMIIRLPGDKKIIVDAKTPIDSYINAVNTGNAEHIDNHVKHIKAHIRTLSQKAYWAQFDYTPEFVLMFLPGESFFSTAIKRDPSLLEYGITESVIITTPVTLIALLKVISFAWHQEAVEKNAREIGEIGGVLVSVLEKLFEYSKDFEKKMVRNVEDYEKINKFIEKTLTPTARKLKHLGIEIKNDEETAALDINDYA